MEYEVFIGLEVHLQLKTRSKIFCSCSTSFGEAVNSQTCPVCLGLPGVLPVLNEEALRLALKTALALNCKIAPVSRFDRKNYFYPDLPKNYQISQYHLPLATQGSLSISSSDGEKRVRIRRIHLEEDAGKLIHEEGRNESLVDFNRCGIPLLEIVTEPDIRTGEEAYLYLTTLKKTLLYLGVSDCNMEQGSLRCDANISLRRKDEEKLGTKTEVKNMNSFHNLQRALNYEIERQRALLERGEEIIQETRLWSEEKRRTYSMRGKEEAHDYRYFPEPDLPPIEITPEYLSSIRATLPELPEARKKRFQTQYQLPLYDAEVLTSQPALADYFESCAKIYPHFKTISNWIMTSLLSQLKEHNEEIENSRVKPKQLVELLQLIQEGVISGKIAKEIFEEMYKSGKNASEIVKERSLTQITEETELKRIITEVLEENQAVVAEYKAGKTKVFTFLVGQVMKKTHGKANPRIVTELLKNFLTT